MQQCQISLGLPTADILSQDTKGKIPAQQDQCCERRKPGGVRVPRADVLNLHVGVREGSLEFQWAVGISQEKSGRGTSLLVQWLRIHLPMQWIQVRCLVAELRSHMPQSNEAHVA